MKEDYRKGGKRRERMYKMRLGGATLQQIGTRFGMSRQRAHQILQGGVWPYRIGQVNEKLARSLLPRGPHPLRRCAVCHAAIGKNFPLCFACCRVRTAAGKILARLRIWRARRDRHMLNTAVYLARKHRITRKDVLKFYGVPKETRE